MHNQCSQYINCRLSSLEMNWLFIKNKDHDSFCWAFDIVDLLKWDYCLQNEMLMFFCDFSLTDPQSLRNWRILLLTNSLEMSPFVKAREVKRCDLFLKEYSEIIFLGAQRVSHNVLYLESSLWKCLKRFHERLHEVSGI